MDQLPVLVLNGVSSSGKSSLAQALTAQLGGVWLTVGTDLLLAALPARFVDGNSVPTPDETDDLTTAMAHLLSETVELSGRLANAGHRLIVDVVCQGGRREQQRWNRAISPREAVWIGLTAPADVLDRREAARGDRTPGLSRLQRTMPIRAVHHDFTVDTTSASPQRLAGDVVERLSRLRPTAGPDVH